MKRVICVFVSLLLASVCYADFNDIYEGWEQHDFSSYKVSYTAEIIGGDPRPYRPTSATLYVGAESFFFEVHSSIGRTVDDHNDHASGWYSYDGQVHKMYRVHANGSMKGRKARKAIFTTWAWNPFGDMLGKYISFGPCSVMKHFALIAANPDRYRGRKLVREPDDGGFEVYAEMLQGLGDGWPKKRYQIAVDPNTCLPVKVEKFNSRREEPMWVYTALETASGYPRVFSLKAPRRAEIIYTVTSFERDTIVPVGKFPNGTKVYDEELGRSYIVSRKID